MALIVMVAIAMAITIVSMVFGMMTSPKCQWMIDKMSYSPKRWAVLLFGVLLLLADILSIIGVIYRWFSSHADPQGYYLITHGIMALVYSLAYCFLCIAIYRCVDTNLNYFIKLIGFIAGCGVPVTGWLERKKRKETPNAKRTE